MDRDELSSPPEEFSPPPEEFPFPGARVTPPPEEFPLPAEAPEPAPGRRRRRLLFYLAAALLLLLLAGRLRPVTEALPPTQAPFDEPTAEPSPTAAPAPSPEASPSPAPEPTPAPTAVPEPECQILFFNFSSSNYVRLLFTQPEAFRSVELSLTEPILDLPVASLTLGPEEIAAGELELPAFATDELYFAHMDEYRAKGTWPEELALHAVLSYEKDGMPVTEVRDLTASPELGWNLSYWPRDTEKYDWNFPGFFRFETYESEMPAALVLDDPEAVRAGVLSVSFSIDGRPIDPAEIQYDTRQEAYSIAGMEVGNPFFYARFLFPKPDWAPESGRIHVTVVQYLEHYDRVVVFERDLDYSEEDYCSL